MRTLVTLTLVFLWCWPGPARAQSPEDVANAEELDRRAQTLFQEGDFERTLEMLEAAQVLAPATSRIYNIATCHERLGHQSEALEHYREFLGSPDAPEDRRERARERIEQLRAPDEEIGPITPTLFEVPDQPAVSHRLSPTPCWVLLGLTGALGITTVALGAITLQRNNEWNHRDEPEGFTQAQGQAMAAATDVLLGLTSASAIAAIIVALFTDWSRPDGHAQRVTFSAGPERGGGTLALRIGF